MKAVLYGNDFFVYLNPGADELGKLKEEPVEVPLTIPFTGDGGRQLRLDFGDIDSGKRLILTYGENNDSDGIEVGVLPEDANWVWIRQFVVTVNPWAYDRLVQWGSCGTRYGASGDKVKIMNRNPGDFSVRDW